MKARWLSKYLCAVPLGTVALVGTFVRADTPAFVLGNVLTAQPVSFTGTRGWQFGRDATGTPSEVIVTQLGVFDDGGDGLVNSHQVGLWRAGNVTGTLLASATVPAGTEAPLAGGYRWTSITPVPIPFGSFYVVAAQYSAGDADDLVTPRPPGTYPNFQFAPDIRPFLGAGRGAAGENLPYPAGFSSCGEGCVPEIFWEPNLQYVVVPEPAVWLFLLSSLLFLRFRRHG